MANRQVTFLINANAQQFKSAMKSAERTFKSVGRSMERTGRKLSQTVTAPLTIMGGLAVTAAAKFENSFADIRKTVNATDQQFRQISDGMRELSRTIPTSVNELNRIGGVAGQLGIQAENIVKFTETIAKLGDTTDIVGEEAALSLSRFMNIMGTARGDIDRLGSTIVGLGNNFAAMESEIVEIGNSLAPLGNAIGLTEQQVLALSTTIAASGGKAQAASTAFQRIGNSMKKAVISGGKSLNRFAEVAGMTAEEFRTAFQENAGQALATFLEGLQRVQEQGGSYAMVLEEMGMGTQRLTREVGKVLGNLDDLNRALPMANQEWQRNTALTEEAQKRYNTLISQLKVLWNRIKDVAITFGNMLIPAVKDAIEGLKGFFQTIANMSPAAKKELIRISKIIAGIPLLIYGIGKAMKTVGAIIGLFMSGAVTSFLTFAGVLSGIIGVFTAVVVGGQSLVDNWDKISQALINAARSIGIAFQKMARTALQAMQDLMNALDIPTLDELLGTNLKMPEFKKQRTALEKAIAGLDESIKDGKKKLKNGIQSYNDIDWVSLHDSAQFAFTQMGKGFKKGLDWILTSSGIKKKIEQIQALFNFNPEMSASGSDSQQTSISSTGVSSGVSGGVVSGLQRAKGAMKNFATVTEAALGKTFEQMARTRALGSILTDVANRFTDSFGRGMANVIVQGKKLADTLRNIGNLLLSSVLQKGISLLLTGGLSGVGGFFGSGGGLFGSLGNLFGVNDALITSEGDVVQFHPDDNILAMRDFSGLATAGGAGGSQMIHNVLQLDGKTIWENQKQVNYKKDR